MLGRPHPNGLAVGPRRGQTERTYRQCPRDDRPAGVRASVVAKKPGNAGGAKGTQEGGCRMAPVRQPHRRPKCLWAKPAGERFVKSGVPPAICGLLPRWEVNRSYQSIVWHGYGAWRTYVGQFRPLCGEPPTGEPYAGELHVRFGGRGDRVPNRSSLPLSHVLMQLERRFKLCLQCHSGLPR